MRPDWDEYFMSIAQVVSTRGTCNRAKVGVVVVDDSHRILATGYNGAPPGEPHCPDDESPHLNEHCPRSIHAEQNVLGHAARAGVRLEGATWYFWPFGPCPNCRLLLKAAGAKRTVFVTGFELRA